MHIEPSKTASAWIPKSPGSHQITYRTPLEQLPAFVDALFSPFSPLLSATLVVRTSVFAPKALAALLAAHNLDSDLALGQGIRATSSAEARALLIAALSDWADFWYVPSPKHFSLYADHDQYSTFFAPRRGQLSRIRGSLQASGFEEVPGWLRAGPS